MAKRPNPSKVIDAVARELLQRFECPLPFHAVGTKSLGSLALLDLSMTPMRAVERLWGGELPVFDSTADANELIGTLVMGLWNQLAEHQSRFAPFRLPRIEAPVTREGVAILLLMRDQEIWHFCLGLVGTDPDPKFPDRTMRTIAVLSRVRDMCVRTRELAEDLDKDLSMEDCAGLIQQFRQVTKVAEHEIHEAVLSCTKAGRNLMQKKRRRAGRCFIEHPDRLTR